MRILIREALHSNKEFKRHQIHQKHPDAKRIWDFPNGHGSIWDMPPHELLTSLRQRIAVMQRSGITDSRFSALANSIAVLFLRAIDQDGHPLREDLTDLCTWLGIETPISVLGDTPAEDPDNPSGFGAAGARNPKQSLFSPNPGSGEQLLRHFAPLQLILQVGVGSPQHGAKIAELFSIPTSSVRKLIKSAVDVSTARWSEQQWLSNLDAALNLFEWDAGQPDLELVARDLRDDCGHRTRLSMRQTQFMEILLKHRGEIVPDTIFREVGLQNLPQLKSRLLKKLRSQGFDVTISMTTGGHFMPLPE